MKFVKPPGDTHGALLPALMAAPLGRDTAVDVFGTLLLEGYARTAFSDVVHLPAAVGEVGTCLWLLVMGVRTAGGQAGMTEGGRA